MEGGCAPSHTTHKIVRLSIFHLDFHAPNSDNVHTVLLSFVSGADPEKNLRGGPESKFCKMKGIHSKNVQH